MSLSNLLAVVGDCPQGYTALYMNPDEYQFPFKGTVRTPTVALGRRRRETRLVAPFYDENVDF